MNNKHSSYKETRGIYQKKNVKKKRSRVFLMLSNQIMWITCDFLIEELKSPAAST